MLSSLPRYFATNIPIQPAQTSIYAIGVTTYLLLTDTLPYQVDPALGWSGQRAFETPAPLPSSINFDVDSALDAIVMRCLEKVPSKRYQNAQALLDALNGWAPKPVPATSSVLNSSMTSKKALGMYTPADESEALRLAKQAKRLVREDGKLIEAADLMEQAFNQSPTLRERYASSVRLWRAGISM